MEWIILFIVSWTLFFLLVDWKNIRTNIWAGFFAILLQLLVDTIAMYHSWYDIRKLILPHILGSSLFFCFGPVPAISILMAQFHPAKRWMAVAHVFVLFALYSAQEYLLVERGAVVYTDWHFHDSVFVNILVMMTISWFIILILNKRKLNV